MGANDFKGKRKEQPTKIFQYRNLGDFEKVLYLEDQVVELLAIAKQKNVKIGKLVSYIQELEDNHPSKKKIDNQRTTINNLTKKLRRAETDLNKMGVKYHKLSIKSQN